MKQAIPNLDETLHAFAEAGTDDTTLADYVRRYPQFAAELIDFAQELREIDVDEARPYTPDTAWENASWARFAKAAAVAVAVAASDVAVAVADPFATLSSARQVEIRRALSVPSTVFNAFRDRQVDPGSVPRPFLAKLADLLGIDPGGLRACLMGPEQLDPAMQFKADDKPTAAAGKVTFADLLDHAMVAPDQRAALLRDEA